LPVVADPLPDFPGPLAGILAGLRWAQTMHPRARDVLSVPTDTPFLPHDLVARLLGGRGAQPLACAASGGWTHPVIGLWPVALADALEAALRRGERKIDAFTARHGVAEIDFATEPFDPFFNVNRPDDLAAAEALITLYPETAGP
jgi:molybdopterin-guanine dinucleotide biosynthesis protein A